MTFREYLDKNGPSIEELAAMRRETRLHELTNAYSEYLAWLDKPMPGPRQLGFIEGHEIAVDVMAYAHMAQDARQYEQSSKT